MVARRVGEAVLAAVAVAAAVASMMLVADAAVLLAAAGAVAWLVHRWRVPNRTPEVHGVRADD